VFENKIYFTSNTTIKAFDIETQKVVHEYSNNSISGDISCCCVYTTTDTNNNSVTKTLYFGGHDRDIFCFDLTTNKFKYALKGHSGSITCLKIHGDKLFSGSEDGSVKEWELKNENKKFVREFARAAMGVMTIHLTDDGKYMYVGSDEEVLRSWKLSKIFLLI